MADDDFEAFVRRATPRLLAGAVLYCGHRQRAEDAVQEALVEVYGRWSALRSPEAYAETVVRRRLAHDGRRWWSRWKPVEIDAVPVPAASTVESEVNVRAILRALTLLPRRQRQILVMAALRQMSHREIAEELGVSVGTVGPTLAKARARVAALLDLVPQRRPDNPLVRSTPQVPIAGTAGPLDPVDVALRAAEAWLAAGFAQDAATVGQLRAAVRAATGVGR
jgi:RNA polymerase sigma-70 factor (ECF subfamily)